MAPQRPLQQKSQSANQRRQRPAATTKPGTPPKIRPAAAPLPVVDRQPSASHTRKRGGGHDCLRCHHSSHPNKEVAEAAIQGALTNEAEWSRHRKLTLNASKNEVSSFTGNSKEARWQPSVQLDGAFLTTTSLSKFLGVTIDRVLFVGPHVAAVVSKASNRFQV